MENLKYFYSLKIPSLQIHLIPDSSATPAPPGTPAPTPISSKKRPEKLFMLLHGGYKAESLEYTPNRQIFYVYSHLCFINNTL